MTHGDLYAHNLLHEVAGGGAPFRTLLYALVLTRQLYTLQKAGVPILRALAGLEASTSHPGIVSLLSLDHVQPPDTSAAMAAVAA